MTDEVLQDPGLDDDAFDESTAEVETKEEETEVAEEKVDKEETEAKAEEEAKEEPTASEQKSVPVAALQDERKKRQALEEKAKALEEENATLKASQSEPVSDNKFEALVEVTTEIMREEHEDFAEKEKIFMDLISKEGTDGLEITDLKLWEQYRAAKNPAKFVYQHAVKHLDFLEKTSPDYEKNLEERIKERVLADMKKRGLESAELPDLTSTVAGQSNIETVEEDPNRDDTFDD